MDRSDRLVVVLDKNGKWQMPGGGWEHGESFLSCLQREVKEELGVDVIAVSEATFMYMQLDRRGYYSLRIAARVTIANDNFVPGDDMVDFKALTRDEFIQLTFNPGEGPIHDYVDQIWSSGIKG